MPLTILGVIFLAIMVFPVYWMINASLQGTGIGESSSLFPAQPTFAAYAQAVAEQGNNFVTSLMVALGTMIFAIAVAAPAAYALAKFRLRGTGALLFVMVVTQMIPGVIIANSVYTLYNQVGLLNTIPGLILADATHSIPFAILILYGSMRTIPSSLIDAAWVDGAGHLRTFRSIVLPLSRNSLITAGLFSFLFAWGDFVFAVTLMNSPTVKPITVGIYTYLSGDLLNWGAVMATATMSALPAMVLLVISQRYIAAGAVSGAVR